MESKDIKNKKLPLGFTFSFPCRQNKLEEVRPTLIHNSTGSFAHTSAVFSRFIEWGSRDEFNTLEGIKLM